MGDDGCVKDDTKHRAQGCVKIVSIIMGILSILMIVFGVVSWGGMDTGKIEVNDYSTSFKVNKNSAIAVLAIGGGVIGLFISVLGCLTARYKTPWITFPFVICAFLVGLMALIAGGMVVGGKTRDGIIDQACNTKLAALGGQTGAEVAKNEYGQLVDKMMCTSDRCPCDGANNMQALWTTKKPEAELNKYQRTWVGTAAPDRNNAKGVYPMSFKTGTGVYSTY